MDKRVVLKIYGEVQGVFFRAQTKKKADELGLAGWVRNERDGTVQIVAEGEEKKLQELIKFCYNIPGSTNFVLPGGPSARVEKIDVEWKEAKGEFTEFSIKYHV